MSEEKRLRERLDQIWGWAKAGKNSENYLMSIENVDNFTDDVVNMLYRESFLDESSQLPAYFTDTEEQSLERLKAKTKS
jgi:hypothetical protein